MLGFSKKSGARFSWLVDRLPPVILGGELCAMVFSECLFLSCCWPVVSGHGDDHGNTVTLQLTSPCGAFILIVLSDVICHLSLLLPKTAP